MSADDGAIKKLNACLFAGILSLHIMAQAVKVCHPLLQFVVSFIGWFF